MYNEFRQCYYDVGICLWTDGSWLAQSDAQTACQRDNSFLPRIANSNIQAKLAEFRSAAHNVLGGEGFWIDVYAAAVGSFHWIDNTPLAGQFVLVLEYSENIVRPSLKNVCLGAITITDLYCVSESKTDI